MLARLGWALEIDGLDAASLPLVSPDALPADVVRLHWSRSLAGPSLTELVRRIDPARLILSGVEDRAALDWARGLGLQRVEGPLVDAALLAQRPLRGLGRAERAVLGAMGNAQSAMGHAPSAMMPGAARVVAQSTGTAPAVIASPAS